MLSVELSKSRPKLGKSVPYLVVILFDPQPVKNGHRVPENIKDRRDLDMPKFAAVVHDHRGLGDAEAEAVGKGQQLQVERVAFHQDLGENSAQNLTLEK